MANVLVQESSLEAIADAIRYKTRSRDKYTPAQMADAIRRINSGGGSVVLIPKTITENGISHACDEGADGFSDVTVDVHPGMQTPHKFDLDTGYVRYGKWNMGGDTANYSDVYRVQPNKSYLIALGPVVGSRFRSMFSTEDISTVDHDVTGVQITENTSPSTHAFTVYKPSTEGYITITKDNAGTAGLKTYVFCIVDMVDEND